jgi:hypothetical protein
MSGVGIAVGRDTVQQTGRVKRSSDGRTDGTADEEEGEIGNGWMEAG